MLHSAFRQLRNCMCLILFSVGAIIVFNLFTVLAYLLTGLKRLFNLTVTKPLFVGRIYLSTQLADMALF